MKFLKWAIAVFWMCCSLAAGAQAARIESMSGSGSVQQGAKIEKVLKGQELPVGATLNTGPKSLVMLRFADGQAVALAENTSFKVAAHAFDASKPSAGRSALNLLRGGMRILTGALGKANPGSISISTPTITVGIRGSDIIITVVNNQVTVQVVSGAAQMTTVAGTGSLSLTAGGVGVAAGTAAPLATSLTALTGQTVTLSVQLNAVTMTSGTIVGSVGVSSAQGAPIASVDKVNGLVTVTNGSTVQLAQPGMPIFEGSRVVTTVGSQVAVRLTGTGCVASMPGAQGMTVTAAMSCKSLVASIQPVSLTTTASAAGGAAGSATTVASAGAAGGASTAAAGATAGAAGATGAATTTVAAGGAAGSSAVAAAGGVAGATQAAVGALAGGAAVTAGGGFSFVGLLSAGSGLGLFGVASATVVAANTLQKASGE